MINLPDILSSEKSEIREIAKKFARSFWTIPFNKGFVAFVKTNNGLFIHPARWRYCFKCGMVLKTNLSKNDKSDDEAINHSCILESEDFPLLVKTSWIKLRKFFLIDKNHNEILEEIGLTKFPKPKIITKSTSEESSIKRDVSERVSEEYS